MLMVFLLLDISSVISKIDSKINILCLKNNISFVSVGIYDMLC